MAAAPGLAPTSVEADLLDAVAEFVPHLDWGFAKHPLVDVVAQPGRAIGSSERQGGLERAGVAKVDLRVDAVDCLLLMVATGAGAGDCLASHRANRQEFGGRHREEARSPSKAFRSSKVAK